MYLYCAISLALGVVFFLLCDSLVVGVVFLYCAILLAVGVVFFYCATSLAVGVVFFYCAILLALVQLGITCHGLVLHLSNSTFPPLQLRIKRLISLHRVIPRNGSRRLVNVIINKPINQQH